MLKRLIKKRQRLITLGLPDALDLTVICVEAGLALDQAMMRVGEDLRHAHPELSDEFHLVNLEMRAGKPRAEALRNLSERTGVHDIRALVATLVQTGIGSEQAWPRHCGFIPIPCGSSAGSGPKKRPPKLRLKWSSPCRIHSAFNLDCERGPGNDSVVSHAHARTLRHRQSPNSPKSW